MAVRSLQAGLNGLQGLELKVFSNDELMNIHLATLDVLWNIGVKVESEEAMEIFDGGGCTVDRKTKIVRLPAHVIEDAVRSTPSTFRACGRNPKKDYVCEKNRIGFVNFGEAVRMVDPYTKKIREPKREDVYNATKFCDALDQIVVFERALAPHEVDQEVAPVYNVEAFLQNSTKHAYIGINSKENIRAAFKMGAAVAGGEEKFRARPLFSTTTDPISPLVHSRGACDVLIEACRLGVPSKINPMGLAGGTTCINLASTLVTHNAEVLSMVVLAQLVKKGHPLVYGSSTGIMDLKTTLAAVGAPELGLFSAAVAKMAQFYLMPSWVAGG